MLGTILTLAVVTVVAYYFLVKVIPGDQLGEVEMQAVVDKVLRFLRVKP